MKIKMKKIVTSALSFAMVASNLAITNIYASGNIIADVADDKIVVGNDALSRELSIVNGHVSTSLITNKRANTSLVPQEGSEDFLINLVSENSGGVITPEITNNPATIYTGTDSKVDVASATLTNNSGEAFTQANVDKLFNGSVDDSVGGPSGLPFTLTVDLGAEKSISSMSVNKRPGYTDVAYGINGTMGGYTISVRSNETDEWNEVAKGEFTAEDYNLHQVGNLYNVGDMVFANFDTVDARYVKVEQTSEALSTIAEFSSSEIAFYGDKLSKAKEEIVPTKVIDRENWSATITNASGSEFSAAATKAVFDGDLDSYPNEYTISGNPFNVDIDLGSEQDVSSISIDKRPGYTDEKFGINGTMGKFELYVSDDGANWQIAGAGNFTSDAYGIHKDGNLFNVGNRVYANFLKTYHTRYVRVVQKDCSLGSSQEFTTSELNLYSDQYTGSNWNTEVTVPGDGLISASDLTYKDCKVTNTDDGKKVTIEYQPYLKNGVTYTINQVFVVSGDDHYMRSFLEISVDDKDKAQIDYIDQDHFVLADDVQGVWTHPDDSKISSQWIGQHELMLGQPIYAEGLFMGSEFPATDTRVDKGETQIRYYSGKTFTKLEEDNQLTTDGKFVSWQNVLGAASGIDTSVVQTDFFTYIEEIATPTNFRKQYNSWYDNMMSITDESIADSFNGVENSLANQGIEPLDSYVVDDGWNNYYDGTYTANPGSNQGTTPNQTGFWEFNAKFPNELYTSSALSDKFQSSFGLWLGPQGGYNYFGSFSKYLESQGTGYSQKDYWTNVCVGSDKYVNNLKSLFIDYQERFNIDYWKWDGFAVRPCTDDSHDHMTGGDNNMYYTTDLWEKWTDLFDAVREARAKEGKGLFINATCYVNLSPWLLQWVNTVWIQDSGDTGQLGTGERHEQKIYYRDQVYYQLYKQNQVQFPAKHIYNHDPIYGVSDGSNATSDVFREYLMANAVRGTAFWELYFSPSIMDEAKWKITADVLDWTESNFDILENAKLFGNQPSKGVYGYSSWKGNEGIISFTNPLDSEQTYELTVDEVIGASKTLSNVSGVQVEPYTVGMLDSNLSYGDKLTVTLQPHETKIFQFGKEDTTKPKVVSTKVTGANEVTVKFSERVRDYNVYQVNGQDVTATLKEDYRTVVLTTKEALTPNSDVTVAINDVEDVYGNKDSFTRTVVAYEDNMIASVSKASDLTGDNVKDVEQEMSGNNFVKITGKATVDTDNSLTGKDDFSVSMAVKTSSTDTTLFKQGDDIELSIDKDGYAVFKAKSATVSSKEDVTTVVEKAHGTFGTDAYVPTSTKVTTVGKINDNEIHIINAVREVNGMIKLYIDGELANTFYDETKLNENITAGDITVGGTNFKGYLSNVAFKNKAVTKSDAKAFMDSYLLGVDAIESTREGWNATACSEESGTTGDGNANCAIDGSKGSWWHTNYTTGDSHAMGDHWIQIDFNKEETFDNFIYVGRGASSNGTIKEYKLEAKVNGEWTTLIEHGTFASGDENVVALDKSVTATAIKLTPISTFNGQNFIAAVEINVSKDVEKLATAEQIKELQAAVVEIDESKYTEASVAAYNAVVAEINALDELNTTAAQIVDLQARLATAKENLTEKLDVNTTILEIAVDEAKKITDSDLDKVVPAVVKEFKAALKEAEAILANPESQKQVNDSFDRLSEVMQMLSFIKGDKTQLQSLVDKIDALDENAYLANTWALLEPALTNARNVLADENALEEEVTSTHEALVKAFLELRLKPSKQLLQDLINRVATLNEADYTAASWKALQSEVAKATVTLNNEQATQEEVTVSEAAMQKAIDGLVKAPAVTTPDTSKPATTKPTTNGTTSNKVNTGDDMNIIAPLAALGLAVVAFCIVKRKKDLN